MREMCDGRFMKAALLGAVVTISMLIASCVSGRRVYTEAWAGERIFRSSCAACHGENADGKGPVAEFLNVPVPDLTRIAARRNGEFPELEVFRIIDGQAALAAHGPRHMPVWGYEFFNPNEDDETAHRLASEKIDSLVAWLRSIQRSP